MQENKQTRYEFWETTFNKDKKKEIRNKRAFCRENNISSTLFYRRRRRFREGDFTGAYGNTKNLTRKGMIKGREGIIKSINKLKKTNRKITIDNIHKQLTEKDSFKLSRASTGRMCKSIDKK